MKRDALALSVVLAAQFLPGCDAQVGEDYRGKPLLSMSGSVLIQNQNPPGNLVPALAFLGRKSEWLEFVDVEVAGEFPARFALSVFEPAPQGTIYYWEDPGDENEPPMAMGYITAVSADHPATVSAAKDVGGGIECDPNGCTETNEYCSLDGSSCYRRVRHCKDFNNDNDCVVIEESGDPSLARGWLRYLAGLSVNYLVFYFPNGVKADTKVAYGLNHNMAMAPGYYLAEVTELTEQEKVERIACYEAAGQDALDRFNAEHGTQYPTWIDVPSEISNQQRATDLAMRERGCELGTTRTNLVSDPARQSITVTISPDVEPVPFY